MSVTQLKPFDADQALALLKKGRTVDGVCRAAGIGRGRAGEVRAVGEAAGLVFNYKTATMAAEQDWNSPPAPPPAPLPERSRPVAEVIVSLVNDGFGLPPGVDAADLGWQDRALCAQTDPEAFFPEKGGSTREAKRVCRSCEVRAECLEYALEHGERWGIWGGLSERERRRVKREAA